jgi:hypothetical protein
MSSESQNAVDRVAGQIHFEEDLQRHRPRLCALQVF